MLAILLLLAIIADLVLRRPSDVRTTTAELAMLDTEPMVGIVLPAQTILNIRTTAIPRVRA